MNFSLATILKHKPEQFGYCSIMRGNEQTNHMRGYES